MSSRRQQQQQQRKRLTIASLLILLVLYDNDRRRILVTANGVVAGFGQSFVNTHDDHESQNSSARSAFLSSWMLMITGGRSNENSGKPKRRLGRILDEQPSELPQLPAIGSLTTTQGDSEEEEDDSSDNDIADELRGREFNLEVGEVEEKNSSQEGVSTSTEVQQVTEEMVQAVENLESTIIGEHESDDNGSIVTETEKPDSNLQTPPEFSQGQPNAMLASNEQPGELNNENGDGADVENPMEEEEQGNSSNVTDNKIPFLNLPHSGAQPPLQQQEEGQLDAFAGKASENFMPNENGSNENYNLNGEDPGDMVGWQNQDQVDPTGTPSASHDDEEEENKNNNSGSGTAIMDSVEKPSDEWQKGENNGNGPADDDDNNIDGQDDESAVQDEGDEPGNSEDDDDQIEPNHGEDKSKGSSPDESEDVEEDDDLLTDDNSEPEWEQEAGTVGWVGGLMSFVGMVFTAWQISENPDGIYAATCRLIITIIGLIIRILQTPFRSCLYGNNPRYSGHMPVATMDYGYKDPSLELA